MARRHRCLNASAAVIGSAQLYSASARAGWYRTACSGRITDGMALKTSTLYAMQYIISSNIEKLYTFTVKEEILEEDRARWCERIWTFMWTGTSNPWKYWKQLWNKA